MFITRTISGIVLLVLIFAAIFAGGNVWLTVTALLSVVAMYEMLKMLDLHKKIIAIPAYICNVLTFALIIVGIIDFIPVMILLFVLSMAMYVMGWPKYNVNDISKVIFTYVYTCLCMSYLFLIRFSENGLIYIWLVFIGAWGSDTCAYLIGILFGKHKIPSTLSPKKTIEGCAGGVAGAALIGALYGIWVNSYLDNGTNYIIIFAAVGAVSSVISQIGDLCASAVKRNCEKKDYGRLIPGHGGIMDRFDSIIFLTPIVYYILDIMGQI